jgi:methyl-accepting chemotaxis protein
MSVENSLPDRLKFIGIDSAAVAAMREAKPTVMAAMPAALEQFYGKILSDPHTKNFFPTAAKAQAAKELQRSHWDLISDARFDDTYVAAVTKVGDVHARIGLEPRWYIGGYALILEELIAGVLRAHWPKRRFWQKRTDSSRVAAQLAAMIKATLLDIDLVISRYLAAGEEATKAVEAKAQAASAAVTESFGNALRALAVGDLTHRIGDDMPPEYLSLREDFNSSMLTLLGTMTSISSSTQGVRSGAEEITQASDDLSRRTEQQAASLEETAAALDQITATVRKVVAEARAEAEHSGAVVQQTVTAMNDIERSSKEIGSIIGTIDEIAFQTNLLALNAGIEAARAGDSGRGFAVVATEVRALAQRSASAAKEIKDLISASGTQVNSGVNLVGRTGTALTRIVEKVVKLNDLVADMAASAQEQASGLHQVNTAVNQMDQVTQQNAAMVEQTTAAAHSLATEAAELARLTGKFQTGGSASAAYQSPSPQKRAAARPIPAKPQARGTQAARSTPKAALVAGREEEWTQF